MTIEEFNDAIFQLLKVRGNAGYIENNGKPSEIYRISEYNAHYFMPPASNLTPEQRKDAIDKLKTYLAQLEAAMATKN